jgi:trehalose 2-sulfotransferase
MINSTNLSAKTDQAHLTRQAQIGAPVLSHPYVVCATPRSGSSLLCTGLEATGFLGTSVEYFSRGAIHRHAMAWGLAAPGSNLASPLVRDPGNYRIRVYQECFGVGRGGLKIHLYQLRLARDLGMLVTLHDLFPAGASQPRLLRTRRQDVVAQAVSGHIADATRVYSQWVGTQPRVSVGYENADVAAPRYDYAEIARRCAEIREHEVAWDDEINESGLVCETIWYEELATDYPSALRRAMETLGLSPDVLVPSPKLIRQATAVNADFVRRFLRDARGAGRDARGAER